MCNFEDVCNKWIGDCMMHEYMDFQAVDGGRNNKEWLSRISSMPQIRPNSSPL